DDQSMQLAEVRLRDDRIRRLTGPEQVVHEFDMSPSGRTVMVMSSSDQPAEVWKLESGQARQLSGQNAKWLEEVDTSTARTISFKSADDVEIHGMVMSPATRGATGPLPLILRIHGGPVSQYQHEFDFEWQLFAAKDRKSTRLNSSHVKISYAVFCLKKKNRTHEDGQPV